jgi:hypothetical protein
MREDGAAPIFPDNAPGFEARGDGPMKALLRNAMTAAVLLAAMNSSFAAPAAACRNTANFAVWLDQF